MSISDEILMAYLDNELAPDERARVETALAGDADLRERLRQQERVHEALRAAFGPVASEPLPERLMRTAMAAPISWRWRLRQSLSRFSLGVLGDGERPFARLASGTAVLLAGIAIGWFASSGLLGPGNDGASFAMAQGQLAQALEQQLAGDAPQQGPRVGVSFSSKSGLICRTFDLGAAQDNKAGLACRDRSGWRVETVVAAEPRVASPYETAGSAMPPNVSDAVKTLIAGEPFDAAEERHARDRGWRTP